MSSVRLISVKFEQSLHVSTRCLPFRSFYINGVYEINASMSSTLFKVLPFACNEHEVKQNVLKAGSATCIYHSEINAYLMYDPVQPAKGPFWRVKKRKDKGERHDSRALWIIESEHAEWGGREVVAQQGVEAVDNSKRKAYRLEHVCSGLYLSLSQSQVAFMFSCACMRDRGRYDSSLGLSA
jgi:hypothetical protein